MSEAHQVTAFQRAQNDWRCVWRKIIGRTATETGTGVSARIAHAFRLLAASARSSIRRLAGSTGVQGTVR